MTLTLNFRSVTADAIKLVEPRNHQIDLRASQQAWDNAAGRFKQTAVKKAVFQQEINGVLFDFLALTHVDNVIYEQADGTKISLSEKLAEDGATVNETGGRKSKI